MSRLSIDELKAAYNGCKEGGHLGALKAVAEAAVKAEREGRNGDEPVVPKRITPEDAPDACDDDDMRNAYADGWNNCREMMAAPPAPPAAPVQDQASKLNLDYLREMARLEARIRELEQASSMPVLTEAMRAVIRNEHGAYDSEDALYAALREAAGAKASAEVPEVKS